MFFDVFDIFDELDQQQLCCIFCLFVVAISANLELKTLICTTVIIQEVESFPCKTLNRAVDVCTNCYSPLFNCVLTVVTSVYQNDDSVLIQTGRDIWSVMDLSSHQLAKTSKCTNVIALIGAESGRSLALRPSSVTNEAPFYRLP